MAQYVREEPDDPSGKRIVHHGQSSRSDRTRDALQSLPEELHAADRSRQQAALEEQARRGSSTSRKSGRVDSRFQREVLPRTADLRQLWRDLPRSKDGVVRLRDFREGLARKGFSISREQAAQLLTSQAATQQDARSSAAASKELSDDAILEYSQVAAALEPPCPEATTIPKLTENWEARERKRQDNTSRAQKRGSEEEEEEQKSDGGGLAIDTSRISGKPLRGSTEDSQGGQSSLLLEGATPDELPPAGRWRFRPAWGEPAEDPGATTLPNRGVRRLREHLEGRLPGARQSSDGAPDLSAYEQLAPEVRRRTKLQQQVSDRLQQVFQRDPVRNMFIRLPRSSDGSTSVGDLTSGLRHLGLKVTPKDVAQLLGPVKGGTTEVNPDTRVAYGEFVRGMSHMEANRTSIPHPFGQPGNVVDLAQSGAPRDEAASQEARQDRKVRDIRDRVTRKLETRGETPSRVFLRVDSQRDGLLSHDEVRQGLGQLGVALSNDQMKCLIDAVDKEKTGMVDYNSFVSTLFPPDIDPFNRAHPLPKGHGGYTGFGKRRAPAEAQAMYEHHQSVPVVTPAGGDVRDAVARTPRPSAGLGRSKLDPEYLHEEELELLHSQQRRGGPSPLLGEGEGEEAGDDDAFLDAHGVYTTGRDHMVGGLTAKQRREMQLNVPAPHVSHSVPRDTFGTPAQFLARTGQIGEGGKVRDFETPGKEGTPMSRQSAANAAAARLGGDVGFLATATAGRSGPRPTRELALRKRENAILRRAFEKLSQKGETRELFMRLNKDHDAKLDRGELREGFARMGVNLTRNEFDLLLNRVDADHDGKISYSEFARALKQDDPAPDTSEEYHPQRVEYSPHRYRPPPDAPTAAGQGVPRAPTDSRATAASFMFASEAARQADSLEQAQQHAELLGRLQRKRRTLRDTYMDIRRCAPDAGTKGSGIRAGSLRDALVTAGIPVSQRQVDAFLHGVPRDAVIDYTAFRELARPRGYVEPERLDEAARRQGWSPEKGSRPAVVGITATGLDADASAMGLTEGEGIGHFGEPPPRFQPGELSSEQPDLLYHGKVPATSAKRSSMNSATSSLLSPMRLNRRDSVTSSSTMSLSERPRTAQELEVAEEHAGLPIAGRQPLRRRMRKHFPEAARTLRGGRGVWDTLHASEQQEQQQEQGEGRGPATPTRSHTARAQPAQAAAPPPAPQSESTTNVPRQLRFHESVNNKGGDESAGAQANFRILRPKLRPGERAPATSVSSMGTRGIAGRPSADIARSSVVDPVEFPAGKRGNPALNKRQQSSNIFSDFQYPSGSPKSVRIGTAQARSTFPSVAMPP